MRLFWILIKTIFNANFGISALKYRFTKEKKNLWEPILVALGVLVGVGSIMIGLTAFMIGAFIISTKIGQPELILNFTVILGQLLVLVFGIFYIMSAFYFSKDIDILIPLPLKPWQILGSKFFTVVFSEYLTVIPVMLPAFVVYGIGRGEGILYWLKALVTVIVTPVIPLAIAAVFIVILMRFVNIKRLKDMMILIGSLIGLGVGIGVSYFTQKIPKDEKGGEFVQDMLTRQLWIFDYINEKLPHISWATKGLSMDGWQGMGYFAAFLLVSFLVFAFLLWLSDRFYFKTILSGKEVRRKRKKLSDSDFDRKYSKTSSPIKAVFWREWKIFLRTPIFVMNGVVGMVIAPVMVIMPYITTKNSANKQMDFITKALENPNYIVPISLVALAIMLFASNMNIIASTAISREGQMFWVSKIIPVPARHQVIAKLLHGMITELIGFISTAVVMAVILNFSIVRIIVIFILAILATIPMVALNLFVDILRPKLDWNNPQQAVKNNLNVLFGMLFTFAVMGVLSLAAVILVFIKAPEAVVYIVLALLSVIITVPVLMMLFSFAEWRYKKIET